MRRYAIEVAKVLTTEMPHVLDVQSLTDWSVYRRWGYARHSAIAHTPFALCMQCDAASTLTVCRMLYTDGSCHSQEFVDGRLTMHGAILQRDTDFSAYEVPDEWDSPELEPIFQLFVSVVLTPALNVRGLQPHRMRPWVRKSTSEEEMVDNEHV